MSIEDENLIVFVIEVGHRSKIYRKYWAKLLPCHFILKLKDFPAELRDISQKISVKAIRTLLL
jgi:hypothetical protein